ncbi:unnamed protein product, partial [Leptidea sinapis]
SLVKHQISKRIGSRISNVRIYSRVYSFPPAFTFRARPELPPGALPRPIREINNATTQKTYSNLEKTTLNHPDH